MSDALKDELLKDKVAKSADPAKPTNKEVGSTGIDELRKEVAYLKQRLALTENYMNNAISLLCTDTHEAVRRGIDALAQQTNQQSQQLEAAFNHKPIG